MHNSKRSDLSKGNTKSNTNTPYHEKKISEQLEIALEFISDEGLYSKFIERLRKGGGNG